MGKGRQGAGAAPGTGRGVLRFFGLLMLAALCSCGKEPSRFPASGEAVPFISGDPARHRPQDDGELARIAEAARNSLPVFFRRLQSPLPGDGNFRIKYPLKADPRSGFSREQVWLSGIRFKDGRYFGVVASAPYYISGLSRGDTIPFDVEEITDWMFTRQGKIIGGRSIKLLLDQIPEHERDEEQRRVLEMFETDEPVSSGASGAGGAGGVSGVANRPGAALVHL
jgi:uncharacterized protein YegJ (DUF2314 family)